MWLPSGGSLVIDRTEAMTVIDVNTGKFTGQGGNLEETVTRNNLEAAEEIVRQLRLRDVGGIVVIDFIDMVLESNRDLVLRRLTECLARDRTKHQVAEVTSLGLVQMTRKRVGAGLLEAFSTQCECCSGRGVILTLEAPAETGPPLLGGRRPPPHSDAAAARRRRRQRQRPRPRQRRGPQAVQRPVRQPPVRRPPGQRLARSGRRHRGHVPGRHREGRRRPGDDRARRRRAGQQDAQRLRPRPRRRPVDTISALDAAARNADAVEDTAAREGTRNGGRRTRRPTNGGTAFAAAVNVEDSPAPAAVVPVVTSVSETTPEPRASPRSPPATPPQPRTPSPPSAAPAPGPAPPSPG